MLQRVQKDVGKIMYQSCCQGRKRDTEWSVVYFVFIENFRKKGDDSKQYHAGGLSRPSHLSKRFDFSIAVFHRQQTYIGEFSTICNSSKYLKSIRNR